VAVTTRLRDVRGRGVALVGGGGGIAVLSADALAAAGLDLPPMPEETKQALHEFIPMAGTSVNNPIDVMGGPEVVERTLGIVAGAENIDLVITNPLFGRMLPPGPDEPTDPEPDLERALKAAER